VKRYATLSATVLTLVTASCSSPNSAADLTITQVRVIDSALTAPSWNLMADSVVAYRIAVGTPTSQDTLTDVLTPLPILVGDSILIGLRLSRSSEDAAHRHLFRRRLSPERLETWPLPSDVWSFYNDVAVSPDGRYFAYVAGGDSGTVALVRELETGREILRGGAGGGCDCDVDKNHARWFAPDSFEIAVAHIHTERGWQIVAGRASTRSLSVTAVENEPEWHR
jgi:WD40 repeat protein